MNAKGTINYQKPKQIVQDNGGIANGNQVNQIPSTSGFWTNHSSTKDINGSQDGILRFMRRKIKTATALSGDRCEFMWALGVTLFI